MSVLPDGFTAPEAGGSLFQLLEANGRYATSAVTAIHAATGPEIGWGPRPADAVYLLLDQIHFTADQTAVLASRTYFLEGRFQFSVLRVR
jgi:GntR family transcriptional regulator